MPSLCWVNLLVLGNSGKEQEETVPVPVLGHRWEREETVPVPVLGHRWERERGDHACTCAGSQVRKREETACTCAGSQVGKRERRLYLYLCWVTGGKAREETVPVLVLGHRWESERGDCLSLIHI